MTNSKPKGYTTDDRFGILNPYGDIWTPETFATEAAARKHVQDFWASHRDYNPDQFRVIAVRVRVTALPHQKDPTP